MTAEQFVAWAEAQHEGRYELFEGELVAMSPERIAHMRTKVGIFDQLRAAIRRASAPCEAFIDGVGFAIDEHSVFVPDAIVRCGDALDGDASLLHDPVIVVEVLSPSTRALDTTLKLERYFSVASVHHYLIVRTDRPALVHHRRTVAGILTQIVQLGTLRLDPPGLELDVGSP